MSLAFVLSLALTQAPAEATPPPAEPVKVAEPVKEEAKVEKQAPVTPWWQRVTVNGFARVGLFYTFPLRDEQLVGGNGGFRLADFRIGADFHPIDKFSVYTSVEFAAPLVDPNDPLSGRKIVELRDAYVSYEICSGFGIRVGQQRPGYYAEMLLSDGAVPFTTRSVLANGVNPPDGYGPRNFLAPDRQLGINLYSQRLGNELLGFKYMVGVFNGNGQNQLFNDNNSVEPVGRIELDLKRIVTLGLNGYYNVRTDGVRPNRLSTSQVAFGGDLTAAYMGFSAMAAFLGKSSTYSYGGLPSDLSMGAMGSLRYFHEDTGLEAAVRFAWYEPSTAQTQDQVMEFVAMVGWKPFKLPFRVVGQFTHREEEQGVGYPNDSVDVMLHAVW
ncbi:MAG: hypothetical protein U0228_25170 [Myxococcaceae bacterium]